MPDPPDPEDILAALSAAFTGSDPPADLLEQLGGWGALEVFAPTLVDNPFLVPVAALVARDAGAAADAGEGLETMKPAVTAVATAMLDTTDPGLFASAVDLFCSDAVLSDVAGDLVASRCLTLAAPPTGEEDGLTEASLVRRAVALEGAARLAVRGRGSRNKLLGLLEDVFEPQPRRYAQAVVRAVTMAFDHWTTDDDIAAVIDILTGVTAPRYGSPPGSGVLARNDVFRKDVAPDAEWAKANIALSKALRRTSVSDICASLDTALEHLDTLCALDERDDSELMQAAVGLLRKLLSSLPTGSGPQDAATWQVEVAEVRAIAARAEDFTFNRRGLNHWSGDRKAAVLHGWSRLADDLALLGDQLSRDSIYFASVVLDDISAIYAASRAYELTGRTHGAENVVAVIRPAIAGGLAARAGLLRNLADHTEELRKRLANADDADTADDLRVRLAASEQVLKAARANLAAAPEPPGKPHEQVADLPPLLADLLGPTPSAARALGGVPAEELGRLAAAIADLQAATDLDPDLMVTATRKRILEALATAEDFRDDVVPAVTVVLDQLIKFVRQRVNSQESWKAYQFDPEANEHHLHVDVYEWLCQGQFGSFTNVEVQEVGAGRVDIQIQFSGFHLYIELKADDTAVPIEGKAAYIKQTVAYQASDVRIGFLVVLRKSPPKGRTPSAHLTEYVSHTTVPIKDSAVQRHVVMLEIPGNQAKPSIVR